MLVVYALATCDIDEVWVVPTFRHALGKGLAGYDARVAMCEIMTAEIGPRASVSAPNKPWQRPPALR